MVMYRMWPFCLILPTRNLASMYGSHVCYSDEWCTTSGYGYNIPSHVFSCARNMTDQCVSTPACPTETPTARISVKSHILYL